MAKQPLGPDFDAFESVTVSTSSVGLTAATFGDAQYALITVETAAVRFRLDGTAPTATVGHVREVGEGLELDRNTQLEDIRFIRRDGADATLRVSYGD